MPFRYLEDIATADIAFEVGANSLEQLFEDAANAVFDSLCDVRKVTPVLKKEIRLENAEKDTLLFDWLAELIYLKDTEEMVFQKCTVRVQEGFPHKLQATVWGEAIDLEKHELRNDVKAVTFHKFELKEKGGKWKATVILDI